MKTVTKIHKLFVFFFKKKDGSCSHNDPSLLFIMRDLLQ